MTSLQDTMRDGASPDFCWIPLLDSSSLHSWLNPLNSWSLREIRGGSVFNAEARSWMPAPLGDLDGPGQAANPWLDANSRNDRYSCDVWR